MMRPGIGLIAAFRRADFDLDGGAFEHARPHQRQQRQIDGRRVAADAAGVVRAAQLLAVDFRQAVDEALQPLGRGMRFAVPAGVFFE